MYFVAVSRIEEAAPHIYDYLQAGKSLSEMQENVGTRDRQNPGHEGGEFSVFVKDVNTKQMFHSTNPGSRQLILFTLFDRGKAKIVSLRTNEDRDGTHSGGGGVRPK